MSIAKELKNTMENEKLVCKDCGTTVNVTMNVDPYASEIKEDNKLYPLCKSCIENSEEDI